jgi:hypothetical protein
MLDYEIGQEKNMLRTAFLAIALFTLAAASATAVIPSFDTVGRIMSTHFGPQGEPTFHGSGLPDSPAVIRDFTLSSGFTARIALVVGPAAAGLPPVSDDGAGTYTAQSGIAPNYSRTGFLGPTILQIDPYAKWNIGYYIQVLYSDEGAPIGPLTSSLLIELLYDVDPSPNTTLDKFGIFDASLYFSGGGTHLGIIAGHTLQGAENLGSTYLRGRTHSGQFSSNDPVYGIRTIVFGAGGGDFFDPNRVSNVFNPNASGEYGLVLRVSDGTVSGQVSLLVNAVQPVPIPAPLPFLVIGLVGFL